MGTNRTRNSSAVGSNRGRQGIRIGRIWNNATETWDEVEETCDDYGSGDYNVITEGVNRSRNSTAVGTNRTRN